jgi:DNA-directed RNA polymerase subunit RPC12/RpoP
MDIVFKCKNCQQELEVDSGAAGQKLNCPSCNQTITVPQADPNNLKVAAASAASAATREEKHFSVPVTNRPVETLIQKPLPSLEASVKDSKKVLRIKTIRHSDCREVGHDHFDTSVTEFLNKVGEENIVSITTLSYSYIELGTQKLLTDYGVMVVYRG